MKNQQRHTAVGLYFWCTVGLLACFILKNQARTVGPNEIGDNGCSKPADIYFVLDASSSIWGPDFKKQLSFVTTVMNDLNLDASVVRTGLLTYGDRVRSEFGLNDYVGRKKDAMEAVSSVVQLRGDTRTDKALQQMRELMTKEARDGIPRIAVVMTDGQSNFPALTKKEAEMVQRSGITMFAIGIGQSVDQNELRLLASRQEYFFHVDNFDALVTIRSMLTEKACEVKFQEPPNDVQYMEGCRYDPMDIVFALDASSSVWGPDFLRQLQFVNDLVHLFPISASEVRIGVLTFGNVPQQQFHLDRYSTAEQITIAVSRIVQQRGERNTASALQFLQKHSFARQRDGARKIAIIITDGKSNDVRETAHQASLFRKRNIQTFVVGVGQAVDVKELQTIATKPTDQHILTVKNYEALNSIKYLLAGLTCVTAETAALQKGEDIEWDWSKQTKKQPNSIIMTTIEPTTSQTSRTTSTTTTTMTTTLDNDVYGCGEHNTADIVFALPSTSDSHQTNEALEFIREMAERMSVSENGVHIGLAPRECIFVPGFTLDQGSDINRVSRIFGPYQKAPKNERTAAVIKYLRNVSFKPESGARETARKIAIVIIEGELKNLAETKRELLMAERQGMNVFVIAIGKQTPEHQLEQISSWLSKERVMSVDCYSDLKRLMRRLISSANQLCSVK